MNTYLITGGAGFIGTNFVQTLVEKKPGATIIVLDNLTYAGNLENLQPLIDKQAITFVHGDICDETLLKELFEKHNLENVVHFAAESHVDRSILNADEFIRTNVSGTHKLLKQALASWGDDFSGKKFHHISTDEVYGDLNLEDPPFTEETPYAPRSPYAASKASSDMLVRAFHSTYGLPILITNCSNNYGPYQYPEKLIPLMLINALQGKALPIYGDGTNIRDWLHVEDHCEAIYQVLENGKAGETYNVGGREEISNIKLIEHLCDKLQNMFASDPELAKAFPQCPAASNNNIRDLMTFVKDRPGHDFRYAISPQKIEEELGFKLSYDFDSGLEKTIQWYIVNRDWWQKLQSGTYQDWIEQNYINARG